jgi:sulfide dehydrogenase cytochrome subunit
MQKNRNPIVEMTALLLVTFLTTSCSDASITTAAVPVVSEPGAPQPAVASVVVRHPGRALAANCFQCHGTDGFASELKIAGESASEIVGELNEMRAENPGRNIMNVHALGYTPSQIALIADYFSKQGG